MTATRSRLAVLVLAVLVLLVGCGTPPAVDLSVTDGRATRVVTITGGYRFDPPNLTVRVGEPVAIIVRNQDGMIHDWSVAKIGVADLKATSSYGSSPGNNALALHVSVRPHGAGKLEFTPTEKGEFTFYCSLAGHRESGMQGTLTVE